MHFKLKPRQYSWRHFILIPLQCAPFATTAVIFQKLLTGLSAVFQVIATANFIDRSIAAVMGNVPVTDALLWLVLLMALVGWRRVSFNIGRVFMQRVSIAFERDLSREFAIKRAKIQFRYVEDPKTWDLVDRVCTNLPRHAFEMLQRSLNFILYLIRIFGVLYIVFSQVWWVGALVSVLAVPLVMLSLRGGKATYSAQKEASEYDRRHKYLLEVMTSREAADERNLFGFSDNLSGKWFDAFDKSRKIWLIANIRLGLSVNGGSAVTTALSSIVTIALIFPLAAGQISFGMFIAIVAAIYDLVNLMGWEMTRVMTQLSRYNEYMKDFTKLANLEEDDGAILMPEIVNSFTSLVFKNVRFKYPGTDTYILDGINMQIQNGIHYAFVGKNGSGKTTITKLMTGLYDNYEGEILLDGQELRSLSKAYLKGAFAGVYQDFARYFISVADNIQLGNVGNMHTADAIENMTQAAADFDILDNINALPKGFNTLLGKIEDDGVDISGGQWQRIAMSRASVSPAPVRILDEPTSALDPISESRMYENFEKMNQGKTTVFISHRLGSTKIANKIFVIEDGKIAEEGSHDSLMDQNGLYAEMYESQRGWYS